MSSLIKIKPQILYAPMLASFGGGSSRGFGRGTGGGIAPDYWGTSSQGYSGYSGGDINFSPSYSYPTQTWDTANFHDALSVFYDLSRNKAFLSYTPMGVRDLYNVSNQRRAIDYKALSSTEVSIPVVNVGGGISQAASEGRGITIAFLSDADRTEVLVIGHSNQTAVYCYNPDTYAFLGKITPDVNNDAYGVQFGSDWSGLAWDGDHLLLTTLGVNKCHAFTMPETLATNSVADLTYKRTWYLPATLSYSMAYAGKNSSGTRRIFVWSEQSGVLWATSVDASGTNGSSTRSYDWRQSMEILLHPTDGSSSWRNVPRSHPAYSSQQYGLGIDYKNLALVYGGYPGTDFCTWPGSI